MTTTAASASPPPVLDLEASPVPGQVASAVLDLSSRGEVVRGSLPNPNDARTLYQMLVEVGNLTNLDGGGGGFKRMTVTLPGSSSSQSSTRYVVSLDETHVYIVQTRAS